MRRGTSRIADVTCPGSAGCLACRIAGCRTCTRAIVVGRASWNRRAGRRGSRRYSRQGSLRYNKAHQDNDHGTPDSNRALVPDSPQNSGPNALSPPSAYGLQRTLHKTVAFDLLSPRCRRTRHKRRTSGQAWPPTNRGGTTRLSVCRCFTAMPGRHVVAARTVAGTFGRRDLTVQRGFQTDLPHRYEHGRIRDLEPGRGGAGTIRRDRPDMWRRQLDRLAPGPRL